VHDARDRGAADALGLVLIAPAVIGLALLVIALGRGVDARAQVRSAAESAAQAAALERSAGEAVRAANTVARAMLVDTDACSEPAVAVDYPTAPPPNAGITSGFVEVTITCQVSNRGVEVIQSGAREESVTAIATVDFFRASGSP
jgi:Flp pilus assembly protein TadG